MTNSRSTLGETTPDWRTFLNLILDRAWLVVGLVTVALLGAMFYLKRAPRQYEATVTAQVEQEEKRVVKIEQVVQEDLRTLEILNTIVQKLQSPPLLARVLQTNGITTSQDLLGPKAPAISSELLLAEFSKLVRARLRRNTRLIDLTVTHPRPELAAQLANSIVGQYLIRDSEVRAASTKGAFSFLRDESERLRRKLEASEQALQSYRQEVGTGAGLQSQDILIPQLRELSLRLTQSRSEAIKLQTAHEQIQKAEDVWAIIATPQVAADPAVAEARSLLAAAELQFAAVTQRYKHKHPKYRHAQTQVESARRGLAENARRAAETLRVGYENSLVALRSMEDAYKATEQAALQHSQQAIRYNLLAREVEADRALFDSVLNRLKETSLTSEIQPERVQIVAPAVPPQIPSAPNVTLTLAGTAFAALLLGGALALCLGVLDTSIQGVDQAESLLGLPVLSAIPRLPGLARGNSTLILARESRSAGAEAFRTLRTSVRMQDRGQEHRTFLFTSALPGEGKTFNSLNFAASLAHQGLRTLLIDVDLRRPTLSKLLLEPGAAMPPGMTDLLQGKVLFGDLIHQRQEVANLFWMSAGTLVQNPAELLGGSHFQDLLEEALRHFDRVVVDSAPVHAVSDTLLLAQKVQTTLVVVRSRRTPARAVARCIQLLQGAGARLGGVVLNQLPRSRRPGYGNYNYGYYEETYGSPAQVLPTAGLPPATPKTNGRLVRKESQTIGEL